MAFLVLNKYLVELASPVVPITIGTANFSVKRVQEWLCYHGFNVVLDGDFGPATQAAVKAFQKSRGVGPSDNPSGIVDTQTWGALSLPLTRAASIPGIVDSALGETICRVARQYLNERAREIGPDNCGMWQRHFSRGRERQPWCQDFATTCYFDAARVCREALPFALCDAGGNPSSYVPWVAKSAASAGKLRPASHTVPIPIGSMFYLKSQGGVAYSHVGIVTEDRGDVVVTCEGNSNNDGSANGFAVVTHFRQKYTCDFGICA